MDNQHRQIKGYRELTQEEIDLMNEIKQQGVALGNLVNKLRSAGGLSVGGDIPCPQCNAEAHAAYFTDVTETRDFSETATLSDD